jgi:hypothetical protein
VFFGPAATAEYGSAPPTSGSGHWASGTMSRIFGTNTPQEAAMDPEITTGTRKVLTALDAAGLTDIGWEVGAAPTFNPADFNHDSVVNAADLGIWKTAFRTTAAGDADADGDSDGNDFLIWQRNIGPAASAPTGASVPEPGALVLAVAALCAALARSPASAKRLVRCACNC